VWNTEPGMIALTIPETARLLATIWHRPKPTDHDTHWRNWRRRHQARARWFHQRTGVDPQSAIPSVPSSIANETPPRP
jgi:hypothetical protein